MEQTIFKFEIKMASTLLWISALKTNAQIITAKIKSIDKKTYLFHTYEEIHLAIEVLETLLCIHIQFGLFAIITTLTNLDIRPEYSR